MVAASHGADWCMAIAEIFVGIVTLATLWQLKSEHKEAKSNLEHSEHLNTIQLIKDLDEKCVAFVQRIQARRPDGVNITTPERPVNKAMIDEFLKNASLLPYCSIEYLKKKNKHLQDITEESFTITENRRLFLEFYSSYRLIKSI